MTIRVFVLSDPDPTLGESIREKDYVTSVIETGVAPRASIGLLTFTDDEEIEAISLLSRGGAVATRKARIRIDEITEVEPPISLTELQAALDPRFARHVHHGVLAEETGNRVLAALERLRPDLASPLAILRARVQPPIRRRTRATQTLALERDAVGLAMDLADIPLRDTLPPVDASTPQSGFLRNLENVVLREDAIVDHDATVFDGWDLGGRISTGIARFVSGKHELIVMNANRTPIENVLGVDLVYYHETYDAFVLVQYKRMKQDKNRNWIYRPDKNHASELTRMKKIPSRAAKPVDSHNYRLNYGPCYFKLCPSKHEDGFTAGLIKGMYLPIEFFEAIEPKGPRGGEVYSYETVPRHLNNTEFIDLVRGGWIGSAGDVSKDLQALIENLVGAGNSVVLAHSRTIDWLGDDPPFNEQTPF